MCALLFSVVALRFCFVLFCQQPLLFCDAQIYVVPWENKTSAKVNCSEGQPMVWLLMIIGNEENRTKTLKYFPMPNDPLLCTKNKGIHCSFKDLSNATLSLSPPNLSSLWHQSQFCHNMRQWTTQWLQEYKRKTTGQWEYCPLTAPMHYHLSYEVLSPINFFELLFVIHCQKCIWLQVFVCF